MKSSLIYEYIDGLAVPTTSCRISGQHERLYCNHNRAVNKQVDELFGGINPCHITAAGNVQPHEGGAEGWENPDGTVTFHTNARIDGLWKARLVRIRIKI
jgi:hypothetical protein